MEVTVFTAPATKLRKELGTERSFSSLGSDVSDLFKKYKWLPSSDGFAVYDEEDNEFQGNLVPAYSTPKKVEALQRQFGWT